jgi:P27 family predicted phage terminase small subunit
MGRRFGPKPGPKPKRNALKALTAGRVPEKDTAQPKAGVPSCPRWLPQGARTEWRRIVAEFATVPGWLTLADRSVLAAYCVHYSNWRDAEERVIIEGAVVDACDKHGAVVGTRANPWVAIAQKECELMTKAGDRLGLSPGARSTLHVLVPQKPVRDLLQPPSRNPPLMSVERLREAGES